MLLQEYDPNKDAVINPEMLVEKVENFPDVTISCFSKKLERDVKSGKTTNIYHCKIYCKIVL